MIGPHYQRLAQIEQKMTAKQMLERIKARPDNPLSRIVDKLKKQFSEYETSYDDPMMDYQITSLDRILSFDSKLGPILDALQKQNQLLRKELGILQGQLSNTVGICEQILEQNTELKLIIKRKNQDIGKIIQTIALNQSEGMDELEQKNSLLMQENSLLMRHLQDVKRQHQRYTSVFRQKDQEKNMLQKKFQEIKKQLTQCIGRQRDLSRKISLLEQNLYQNSEQIYGLQQTKQNLTFENNQLKNQVLLLQGKSQALGIQTVRRQVQSEFEPIIQQHKLLKKERGQLLRESEKGKLQREKMEDIIAELEKRVNKFSGDLQLTNSLLLEKRNQNSRLINSQNRFETKLAQLKEENNHLRAQKETGSTFALNREKRLLQQIDDLRKTLEEKQTEIQARMRQIKDSMHGLLESKDLQVKNLRQQNIQLQRILERR